MSFFPWSFAPASRQVRRSVRRHRQRERLASGESLEPRLALATGLLETLVTIADDAGGNLLDHATAAQAVAVGEGEELVASVRLARRPNRPVTVRLATNDPLEVAPSVGALRFTRANWNIPQPVAIRSIADGVADGDQRLAAQLTVATAARRPLTQRIWIDSRDTGEESPAVAASGVYRGTLAGGASGSVVARYGANEGTATFRIRAPRVPGFGNRVVSIDYAVTSANEVAVLAVRGVAASRVRLDLSYRMGPQGPGLSGTLELRTPAGGRATAMRFSAALVTAGMPRLEGYAASPATSAAVGAAPAALAVGVDGTGWVANEATNAVQRLVRQGGVWTVADTIPVGTAPGAIAVAADGSAWVANTADATIQHILKINGVWTAGSPLAVAGNPTAIAAAADGGIWIATAAADGVQRIAMVGGSPSITATLPFGEAPAALAVGSDGGIWVALAGANAVQRITAAGTGWRVGSPIPVAAGPSSLATAADGSIWVASAASGSLQQVLRARRAWRTQPALTPAGAPADVAVHPDGSVWVAAGDSLQRFVRSRAGWVAQSPISVGGVIAAIHSAPDGTVLAADAQAGIVTAVSAVPSEVRDLAVTPTGVGELLLSWEAPVTGDPTSYTVTMNTTAGNGTTTSQSRITSQRSLTATGLSSANAYVFSVVATNAGGTSPIETAAFGQTPLTTYDRSYALTTGQDGSIWVASAQFGVVNQFAYADGVWTPQLAIQVSGEPIALTTGLDGSIWVSNLDASNVQQIANVNGVWTAQSPISVMVGESGCFDCQGGGSNEGGSSAENVAITTSSDGSIWVANRNYNSVQQIAETDGTWAAMTPISLSDKAGYNNEGPLPNALTYGADGSIWFANQGTDSNEGGNSVQQALNVNGVWTAQPAISVGSTPRALTTGLDGSIWVANTGSNTVQQIAQVNGAWVAQPAIAVGAGPRGLVTGLDGSIWVANTGSNTVQQIADEGGVWTARQPIAAAANPFGLTAGLNGALWVTNTDSNTLQQIVIPSGRPLDLSAETSSSPGNVTLNWNAPVANGGAPITSYTATVWQGEQTHTIQSSTTSAIFEGFTPASGPTYFTVTATNFAGVSNAAVLQIDRAGNPSAIQDARIGFTSNGASPLGLRFDDAGNSYSWDAMGDTSAGGSRIGNTLLWNGVTFELGSPNQPDVIAANGQTVPVSGGGNVLSLAAAAVNGSQESQQIVLTFTDSSTAVWTQSFSDWCDPQNYSGESTISEQSYLNTLSSEQESTPNNIYGYSYALPEGKTLTSITLPNNPNLRLLGAQFSTSTPVDLSGSFNFWGIANGQTQAANNAGFDRNGHYYYSGDLPSSLTLAGVNFEFGPTSTSKHGTNNFVQARGQSIDLPQGSFGRLSLAAAAANGSQTNQEFMLHFSDGSEETWTQSLSDWCDYQSFTGQTVLHTQSNWVDQVGNVRSQTNRVYGYTYELPAGKTLVSITLPNNQNVGILGITLA